MGLFVIAAFRAKDGKVDELMGVVRDHHAVLTGRGLVTDRAAVCDAG